MKSLGTCVTPSGKFRYGIHRPSFRSVNFRVEDKVSSLGSFESGYPRDNKENFPIGDINETSADIIYEIPNPFPFRGTTYIAHPWAEFKKRNPDKIKLPEQKPCSLTGSVGSLFPQDQGSTMAKIMEKLPQPVLLALAANSTDPEDLTLLAEMSCDFQRISGGGIPEGMKFTGEGNSSPRAIIKNHDLFETVVNNPYLPDPYKEVMVLRPGVQGGSEIVGEWRHNDSHIFEYLRRNSYIPWGHYAANMANDAVRYSAGDLSGSDITGLRHLYYQRTYTRLAEMTGVHFAEKRETITEARLEELREMVLERVLQGKTPEFTSTLWGWNFGFDFAPSGYRLHASHQQIHQQFALIPASAPAATGGDGIAGEGPDSIPSYGCGDLVTRFIGEYRKKTGQHFFDDYLRAIRSNKRMDGEGAGETSLIVMEDENVIVFVPKAQTSQWELQIMTQKPLGNILETGLEVRRSLDKAMLKVMKAFTLLGARMITVIEFPKRFDETGEKQHLLYSFLPKLPESPGAFSEAQLRWINGHFPEDFAAECRRHLPAS